MKYFLFLFVFFGSFVFAYPENVSAAAVAVKPATLAPGTLFKFKDGKVVYFVASDAVAYPFPDEKTFFSWNASFSKVKVYDKKTVANTLSKLSITIKPGVRVVKFGADPKLYAVGRGARIYWIVNEKVLVDLFGSNWRNYYDQLPADRITQYTIADKITDAKNFHRDEEKKGVTISQELNRRKILKKETIAIDGSVIPLLKSLKESVSANFSPAFSAKTFYYTLKTTFAEDKLVLTPAAYDSYMTVKVKDYAVDNGKNITLDIPTGKSEIPVYVTTPEGRVQTYTVQVTRSEPSDDAKLKSLTENLPDTMWPTFKPNIGLYTLRAKEGQNRVIIKAVANHPKAHILIDGNQYTGTSGYDRTLKVGLNVIEVVVVAENNSQRKYTIEIQKPL